MRQVMIRQVEEDEVEEQEVEELGVEEQEEAILEMTAVVVMDLDVARKAERPVNDYHTITGKRNTSLPVIPRKLASLSPGHPPKMLGNS